MISPFGIDHGYVSKSDSDKAYKKMSRQREFKRDAKGRFAAMQAKGKKDVKMHGLLSDDDLDEQYDWYHPDYKSLWMLAEKDPKEYRKKRRELEEDAHYWHGRKEFDLADDIWTAIDTSKEIYAKHHKKTP